MVRRPGLAGTLILIIAACSAAPPATTVATPPCAAASVRDVAAALEAVPSYTFTASGTSLRSFPQKDPANPWRYDPVAIELRGAYRAPDRSRLEVVTGAQPLTDPQIFFLGADAIVVIGNQLWMASGDDISGPTTTPAGRANLLLNALRGAPELGELSWVSAGACTFTGRLEVGAYRHSVRVEVGSGALPTTIVEEVRYEPPNEPRRAYELTYQPDYSQVPAIEAPAP